MKTLDLETVRLFLHVLAATVWQFATGTRETPGYHVFRGQPAKLRTVSGIVAGAARFDPQGGGWHVSVDFKGAGEKGWARLTGEAACHPAGEPGRRVAIVLDDKIISSPQVDPSVACRSGIGGGSTQITGSFDDREAKELALLISR